MNKLLMLIIALFIAGGTSAQMSGAAVVIAKKDVSTDTARAGAKPASSIKPYKEVITEKARTSRGMIIVHRVEDKIYFEIPASLFGKDLLTVSRISKSPAGFRAGFLGYAGDQINEAVIRWEKSKNNKVFLRTVSYIDYSKDSSKPLYTALQNNSLQAIAAGFDVKAFSPDGRNSVIDVTEYLNGDNDLLFFEARLKNAIKLGGFQKDLSYVDTVKTYPRNTEIRTMKTYGRQMAPNVSFEINTSIIALPEQKMKPRLFDARVGYFASGFYNYDVDPQGVQATYYVRRWRMEPRAEDREKYLRGELVEPAKKIVIYIDPATPKIWVPYLIQGVNDWQKAFEKAGFKNAIIGKEAPSKQEDSTWSIDDSRYSVIVYKPSPIPNASGPHVADPRTGEILETHISWYHNVMKLVRNWYFIQAGAVDPRANKMNFEDTLMGELIRFVSSHEVGHTLGLRHNYGASSTVPVEKLRDKKWLDSNGHTPSIMDYARFNYVAQPEDGVTEKGLFPRIGDYDNWAIEWGYKWMPQYEDEDAERPFMNKWTTEKLQNKRLWFGTETISYDPRTQNEDLGDNAMKASAYGIRNLKRIMDNIEKWSYTPNQDYSNLNMMYGELVGQYKRYLGHVTTNIGGIYVTPRTNEEGKPVYDFVTASKQKEALQFLSEYLFKAPLWLCKPEILKKVGRIPQEMILGMQGEVLTDLISGWTWDRIIAGEQIETKDAYSLRSYLIDLKKAVIGDFGTKPKLDIWERNIQKLYVEKFKSFLNIKALNAVPPDGILNLNALFPQGFPARTTDVYVSAKEHLLQIQREARAAAQRATDEVTRAHYRYIAERVTEILAPKGDNII